MHRFYYPDALIKVSSTIHIRDQNEIHHITDVLRLKKGTRILVFNGLGQEASGTIIAIKEDGISIHLDYLKPQLPASQVKITLACAIPKKAKFESIIEKCTELGVDEIIPLHTTRTIIKIPSNRQENKRARYKTIAVNAAKQSGRAAIPLIHPVTPFTKAVAALSSDSDVFIPSLSGERKPLMEVLANLTRPSQIVFFIGPEGDFTPQEISLAKQKGAVPTSLGSLVLKVDTAAIAAVAMARLTLIHE